VAEALLPALAALLATAVPGLKLYVTPASLAFVTAD
jgi:hypothetical protein